jgi:hypothetical protein
MTISRDQRKFILAGNYQVLDALFAERDRLLNGLKLLDEYMTQHQEGNRRHEFAAIDSGWVVSTIKEALK